MKNAQFSIRKIIDHCSLNIVHSQSGIAAIIIIAAVIIGLAILVTLLKFTIGGSKPISQASPLPSSSAIAHLNSSQPSPTLGITPTPIADTLDQCSSSDPECAGDTQSEFSGEGDGVTAADLDGEG